MFEYMALRVYNALYKHFERSGFVLNSKYEESLYRLYVYLWNKLFHQV